MSIIFILIIILVILVSIYSTICGVIFTKFTKTMKPNSQKQDNYKKFIENKKIKDFTIKIDNKDFKYHYFDNNSENTIILVHGVGGSKDSVSVLAEQLYKVKNNIILYDVRYHEENKNIGTTPTFGYFEKEDLYKIITNHIKNYSNHNIKLYGVSMGGATVLAYAQKYDHLNLVKSYICESTYKDMFSQSNIESRRQIITGLYPFKWGLNILFKYFHKYSMYKLNFEDKMTTIKNKMLLLTPSKDPRIDKSNSLALFKKSDPNYIKYIEFEEESHARAWRSINNKIYFDIIIKYFNAN